MAKAKAKGAGSKRAGSKKPGKPGTDMSDATTSAIAGEASGDVYAQCRALEAKLGEQQRRFCIEYEYDYNITQAAIRAGYSEKSAASQGSRLMKSPKVAAYRKARAAMLYESLGFTPDDIGIQLREIFIRCMQGAPHLSWSTASRSWEPDGTWVFDAKNALRALEVMGKAQGIFSETVKVTGGESVERFLERWRGSDTGGPEL